MTSHEIADLMAEDLPRNFGALQLWGESFGRPGEDRHTLLSCSATTECVRLHFTQDEVLAIWNPAGVKIRHGALLVLGASAMRWTRWQCGKPHTLENLWYWDYAQQEDGRIAFRTNNNTIPGYGILDRDWTADHPAVELAAV